MIMKLASFETITEILPIEGADKIEIARVQGWQSVIRKGEYKVGDQVIFVPIDTVLTPRPWNEFLWDKKDPSKPIRVKTVKLKGVISSGLIFAIENLFKIVEKNGKKYINICESIFSKI